MKLIGRDGLEFELDVIPIAELTNRLTDVLMADGITPLQTMIAIRVWYLLARQQNPIIATLEPLAETIACKIVNLEVPPDPTANQS
jgi:hypothetical protein